MSFSIGFLVFPGVQQVDLTGPYEVFSSTAGTRIELVWKTAEPVMSSTGLLFHPTVEFSRSPQFDLLCVPGGGGVNALLEDEEVLDFVRRQASGGRYITSVCTGSLVLGAAGLLRGRKAATHWNAMDFLAHFGATPVWQRVVRDGNLITAGGITSGIDFALEVVAEIFGVVEAQTVQLSMEYAPSPPFQSGTPDQADADIVSAARQRLSASRAAREGIVTRLVSRSNY